MRGAPFSTEHYFVTAPYVLVYNYWASTSVLKATSIHLPTNEYHHTLRTDGKRQIMDCMMFFLSNTQMSPDIKDPLQCKGPWYLTRIRAQVRASTKMGRAPSASVPSSNPRQAYHTSAIHARSRISSVVKHPGISRVSTSCKVLHLMANHFPPSHTSVICSILVLFRQGELTSRACTARHEG